MDNRSGGLEPAITITPSLQDWQGCHISRAESSACTISLNDHEPREALQAVPRNPEADWLPSILLVHLCLFCATPRDLLCSLRRTHVTRGRMRPEEEEHQADSGEAQETEQEEHPEEARRNGVGSWREGWRRGRGGRVVFGGEVSK